MPTTSNWLAGYNKCGCGGGKWRPEMEGVTTDHQGADFAILRPTNDSWTLVRGVCGRRYLPVFPAASDVASCRHFIHRVADFGCRHWRVYLGRGNSGTIASAELRPGNSARSLDQRRNVRDICRALRLWTSPLGRATVPATGRRSFPADSHARDAHRRAAGCFDRHHGCHYSLQIRASVRM